MRLPADVLIEALLPLGKWEGVCIEPGKTYGFPRQFAGGESLHGHAVVLPPGQLPQEGELLAVFTAPEERPCAVPALIPEKAADIAAVMAALTIVFDQLETWDEMLQSCGADLPGIQDMLDISTAFLGGSLGLIDVSYNMPALTGDMYGMLRAGEGGSQMRPDDKSIERLAADPSITAVRSLHGVREYEGDTPEELSLFRNMFRPGEDVYYNRLLYAREGGKYTALERFALEHLAGRIEKISRHLPTYSTPASEYAALKQLIPRLARGDSVGEQEMAAALAPLGWREEDSFRFYIFRSMYPERDAGITDYIVRRLEQLIPGSCAEADTERILLVQNLSRGELSFRELRSRLAVFLGENMYKAGISNPTGSFTRLRGGYLQAEAAMVLGERRDPMFWYYLFENYLADYLLDKAAEEIPGDMLIHPGVALLLDHDAHRGTHFSETLGAFVRENFNATRAAKRLYIHRTSFQDRVERIRELTGLDLESEETRFLLSFSYRLTEHR